MNPLTPAEREALDRLLAREPEPDPIPEPIWPEDTVLLICVLLAAVAFWLRLN